MSGWEKYFEKYSNETYGYKDKNVVELQDNLPMPPTSNMHDMFKDCHQLKDISALYNWDTSKVTNMNRIFQACCQLKDISALSNRDVVPEENKDITKNQRTESTFSGI